MGNINTKTNANKNESLSIKSRPSDIHSVKQLVDDIALQYILTMNFESLTKLYKKVQAS